MLLTLSFTILPNKQRFNVQVDENQVIADTLSVLNERGLLPDQIDVFRASVESARNEGHINPRLTYSQANIYNGDIIYVGK
ncbi:MAG: hypothetical protein FWC09_07725 [Lachnospiraceae bacterium]|nr:hypothetical protein [Lachnospiraceae bacterium]